MHVRFSSQEFFNSIGGKAVPQHTDFESRILNVSFSQKRTFISMETQQNDRPLSAKSGRSQRVETPPKWAEFLLSNQVKADASLTSGGLG